MRVAGGSRLEARRTRGQGEGLQGRRRLSPVPDKEVSISREWHRRVLPQGNRVSEV